MNFTACLYTNDGHIDRSIKPAKGGRFTDKELDKLVGGKAEAIVAEAPKTRAPYTFVFNPKSKKTVPNKYATSTLQGFSKSPAPDLYGDVVVLPYLHDGE